MEETRSRRTEDVNREKNRKKNVQEKKTKSDTSVISSGSSAIDPLESVIVVGKSFGYAKSKSHESGNGLNKCYSETAISALSSGDKNFKDVVHGEAIQLVPSNSSFITARSDISDILHKKVHDMEDTLVGQNLIDNCLIKPVDESKSIEFNSVSTETEERFNINEDDFSKLKDLENVISIKEKKIKDLHHKLEKCSKIRDIQIEEKNNLTHQINLLNRQLQSLYELLETKNWCTIDPVEFAKCKNKVTELEACIVSHEQEKNELFRKIKVISSGLEFKEKELTEKSRELVDYKSKTTLEMCKFISQIENLQKEAKTQSQLLNSKILEVQNSMDEEIYNVTQKLEEQYQIDKKLAIEKIHADFERLADLPKNTIEKLILFCESDKTDIISFQKDWDKHRTTLEARIESMQLNHNKEIMELKNDYESKIAFLKIQVETLLSQLKERKDVIDIFEDELMMYKNYSSVNLLKGPTLGDDISALKELYIAEIFSQKQIHNFQFSIFEEKVKTLTEEILYHAKNEEIYLQELENAKKMAFIFREKYEKLVFEWEERVEKDTKIVLTEDEISPELETMITEFKDLIQSLKKSEEVHEEKIKMLEMQNEDEKFSLLQHIEDLKIKLQNLKKFQKTQVKFDETIHGLIKSVGVNYTKTVEALLMSHVMELSFKQMEICVSEKRHIAEIDALKIDHEKELEELRKKFESLEELKIAAENEVAELKKIDRKVKEGNHEEIEGLRRKLMEMSIEYMKSEGMIAIKEEIEQTLNDRIKELENIIRLKEKNCQKELEDLTTKYLKVKVLSSAKDDLAKELEDKLNESEFLLEKSCNEIDRLTQICSQTKESAKTEAFYTYEGGDFKVSAKLEDKFQQMMIKGECLSTRLTKTLIRADYLEDINLSNIPQERNQILNESNEMKERICDLEEEIRKKEKVLAEELSKFENLKEKLEILETEKDEILLREKMVNEENKEILQRNEFLERNVKNLNERISLLTTELENSKNHGVQEVFSVSLQEIRFLYEENVETNSTSTVACQVEFPLCEILRNLLRINEELQNENENLKLELEKEINSKTIFHDGTISKFENIQTELSLVIDEKDGLVAILESLEKERDNMREKLENLREENCMIRARYETNMKIFAEKKIYTDESRIAKMNKEIVRLTEYINLLSNKLDIMRANNELLVSESHKHLRQNQNLVNELEEAWSERYEIEDQLAKVRRENVLINLHRKQLEETNKKISSLVAKDRSSVGSWFETHDSIETTFDGILDLKTPLSGSHSVAADSTRFDLPNTNSGLKLMTGSLHLQVKNKTTLYDELNLQKEMLKRELKILEKDWEPLGFRHLREPCSARKGHLELQNRQPDHYSLEKEEVLDPSKDGQNSNKVMSCAENCHFITLNKLKKHLEHQVKLEEAQFRENLKREIQNLKECMQGLEESSTEKNVSSGDDSERFKSTELQYEKEVVELTKEFEREVEKLKETFGVEKEGEDFQNNYEKEIENLKNYFEKKWTDLEKRYIEIYSTQKRKKQNPDSISDINHILEQFHAILNKEDQEEEKKAKIESFLMDVLSRRDDEMKSLLENYKKAVNMLEVKHSSEIQRLQSVVLQLKENIMMALKKEKSDNGEELVETDEKQEDIIKSIRTQYEAELEKEKKKFCDLLEAAKQTHEKEILALEDFWTEKLSECETKCAIMKATSQRKTKNQGESEESCNASEKTQIDKSYTKEKASKEERLVSCSEDIKDFDSYNYVDEFRIGKVNLQGSLCVSCLANQSFFKRMELKTDDDKLDVIQQRDTLEEMISSARNIITKLLTFITQNKSDLNSTSLDIDSTMYKSFHIDLDRTTDMSTASNSVLLAMDLSTIFQEIKNNSLLNSSDQVRFELDRCLKQLKKDATCLLALSCPENFDQSLNDLIKKVLREKNELETQVLKVEEMQKEMKKEINMTKDRLSQWERNLEVVSEGYGEEIVEPKQIVSLSDLKGKLKLFLTENCGQSPQDINLVEEICKEGDRLQQEWLKEKYDLQQQIDVADKQLHSLKKFLEEQALEREQEQEAFDREIRKLQENLKAKERDNSLQNRMNREGGHLSLMPLADDSVEALVVQVKELTTRLTEAERNKGTLEEEFQNAVKKIWSLREVIQDLEVQLAEVSERENNLKKNVEKLDGLIEEHSKINRNLKEELEVCRNQNELKYSEHIKCLEEELLKIRHIADQVNPDNLTQLKASLRQIEAVLIKKTKDLEQVHVSSANVSCSSPSEDVSIRDHLDATRCSTPDEMCSNIQSLSMLLPMEEIDRIHEKLARHTRVEEVTTKHIQDLKMQLRNHRKAFEEVQTERDILLEKVDVYLKENSSLKVRLEEQRCNAGLLQKQLNANLESQINRLEVDVEKLNEMCNEKDKQLRDMKVLLENTTKSLKIRETEALNKSKEENTLITTLKTDLANALNENEKLEEQLEKTKGKLRESLKMPALIDSMIDEKNAEIDRLEKEVARLSSEKTTSGVTSRSYSSEEKLKRKIRFSEPDSFSENISSISVQCVSDMRNCSDSCADFKNSSFKIRRPIGCSTKLESVSSIAPLQLSPRGADSSFYWKSCLPVFQNQMVDRSPCKTSPTKMEFQQMEEISKLQKDVELKQREISELHLEVDILKRQLVEVNQEVATAKSLSKEIQNDLTNKNEEIRKLENNEKSLLMTIESLKKNHAEEVEELHNKLNFEHGKVEKVYEEIKALEVKKIEIEESFLSLKEDYKEKISGERKTAETLLHRIRTLEARNGESDFKLVALEKELENTIKESERAIQALNKEILDLKNENEKIRSVFSQKKSTETQVEGEVCMCQKSLTFEMPKTEEAALPFRENLDELKTEFDKMAAVIKERDFNKKEAFSYAMAVKRLLSVVLSKLDELSKEVEAHMKKVMECSVDDLAIKVQRELVLSAKLDNQLLSSIEANGFESKATTFQPDSLDLMENSHKEMGGGDGKFIVPETLGNSAMLKIATLYQDVTKKMSSLEKEREILEGKILEQQKIIRLLEESLKRERERILEEKERCSEDAKIMELLRVNLERRLIDIKTKDKELKKEKQLKMALEKEIENCKKQSVKNWESKKVMELNAQLESQKEKLVSLGHLLEEEKKKNQELRLSLEEERIERMAEKNAQMLIESDLTLLREQKENLKKEILNTRQLLHSRNVEIGLLKRKVNLQEIDIKALSLSSTIHPQNSSGTSSVASNAGSLIDLNLNSDSPSALLFKMRKLNSCVQRHVKESSEMGEALLYLSQETEQMRDIIKKLEENNESKLADETLVPDVEVERKLWALEKGRLVMDLETLKKENEVLKQDLVNTCKSNEGLKQENYELKKEIKSPKKKKEEEKGEEEKEATSQIENSFLQERVSHLSRKCMRTESYRKALAWQKHYLLITLQEYQRSEEEAWRKMGKRKKDGKRKGQRACRKFRVVALAAIAIFRMKFIVKRWQRNALNHVFSLLESQNCKFKLTPLSSMLNVYSEPVNPLSYQTQNIFRQSSSQVLRTPPSRDPGPRNFSFDFKNVPDRLEKFDYLQENIGTVKGLH